MFGSAKLRELFRNSKPPGLSCHPLNLCVDPGIVMMNILVFRRNLDIATTLSTLRELVYFTYCESHIRSHEQPSKLFRLSPLPDRQLVRDVPDLSLPFFRLPGESVESPLHYSECQSNCSDDSERVSARQGCFRDSPPMTGKSLRIQLKGLVPECWEWDRYLTQVWTSSE